MANPYTAPSLTNYNANPPVDDGTKTEANGLKWATHKTKLGDPLKAFAEAISAAVSTAFGKLPFGTTATHSSAYTLVADDQGKVLRVSGTTTITLLAAASAGDGYNITIKNVGTDTVTIDGDAAETIDGAATLTLDDQYESVILVCDGAAWHVAADVGREAAQATVVASSRGLVAKYVTAASVDIDADAIVLKNTAGESFLAESVNLTANITASGANGLDTGAEANSTWYYLWVIYNGTTVAGLISASSTAPTMPSGYTFKALVGSFLNDSSGDIVRFVQQDRIARTAPIVIFTATAGPATYTTQSVAAGVPPIATSILGYGGCTATTTVRHFVIAADANGVGEQYIDGGGSSTAFESLAAGTNFDVPLLTASTVFWKAFNTGTNHRMVSTGYRI